MGRANASFVVTLTALATAACGPSLRAAEVVVQPVTRETAVVVDYPPPPADVEFVRRDPGEPCVWVDGQWKFVDQLWQWESGAWVVPEAGCVFAQPNMLWFPNTETSNPDRAPTYSYERIGKLYYVTGRWVKHPSDGEQSFVTCPPARPCRVGH